MQRIIPVVFSWLILFATPLCAEWNNINDLKVAILELEDRVAGEEIDTATLSEMLQLHLVDRNAFQIVARSLVDRILEEQEFQLAGFSSSEMMKIGSLAGANKIIAGSISRINETYYLLIKGLDTVTGVIDLSDQIMAPGLDELLAALPVLSERIVRKARGEEVPLYSLSDPAAALPELPGRYAINGTNPDGSKYYGEVVIERQGNGYRVTWYIGESVYTGEGRVSNGVLTVDYGDSYPAIYRLRSNGVLDGSWADGSAYEVLTPKE
jgi:Curli production assembly/transport component CsgG